MCDLDQIKVQEFVRKSRGQLERETGIPKETWSRWFGLKHSPNLATLSAVAPKLGLTLVELVAGMEQKIRLVQQQKPQ